MPYTFLDHTADVAVELTASSAAALFADAAVAFADTLIDLDAIRETTSRTITVSAPELDLLLLDWLGELLFAFEAQNLLVRRADVNLAGEPGAYTLDATIHGETLDPLRHGIKVLIKAVTYHGLAVEQRGPDDWWARVIFDI
jgi:SHS2 domain-containing protein